MPTAINIADTAEEAYKEGVYSVQFPDRWDGDYSLVISPPTKRKALNCKIELRCFPSEGRSRLIRPCKRTDDHDAMIEFGIMRRDEFKMEEYWSWSRNVSNR